MIDGLYTWIKYIILLLITIDFHTWVNRYIAYKYEIPYYLRMIPIQIKNAY